MPRSKNDSESDHEESEESEEEEVVRKKRTYKKKKKNNDDGKYRPSTYRIPKKPKPVNAPKRPMTAYFLFAASKRDGYKKENPEMKLGEVSKAIGTEWKALDDDDKEEFVSQAGKLMKKYKTERKKYEQSSAYKRYKKQLAEWNDLYKEEWEEQQYEKEQKRLEAKKKKSKKTSSSSGGKRKRGRTKKRKD
mmetsp:Transcript_45436/g.40732  ORF Transcript_45436/g.40732 Transcript_45436/m.40732 type:complete len:191 (+) Transcript_45436:137-709(+)|eukprot:CAMPEP_0201592062 /NCGR_PEP_ID=MMETSP0190_2-20130828/190056_1 /ASSEMBLY_ACC=CAM_ASM_000263 /TAXON_ID=37353 /ORGANISM="Rosalina sp." /LENGTH=190 /DNA_ID=CAMNT_0048050655 /DNA_START=121 /DNA_END=693 /DNA_ORIENTATION=+